MVPLFDLLAADCSSPAVEGTDVMHRPEMSGDQRVRRSRFEGLWTLNSVFQGNGATPSQGMPLGRSA